MIKKLFNRYPKTTAMAASTGALATGLAAWWHIDPDAAGILIQAVQIVWGIVSR